MTITKIDERWFKAEQKINNGILSYIEKAYSSTSTLALVKLIKKLTK